MQLQSGSSSLSNYMSSLDKPNIFLVLIPCCLSKRPSKLWVVPDHRSCPTLLPSMEFLDIMESLLGDPFNHVLQFRAWCNDPNQMLASAGGNMDAKNNPLSSAWELAPPETEGMVHAYCR